MSKTFVYNLLLDHLLSFIIVVTKITGGESPIRSYSESNDNFCRPGGRGCTKQSFIRRGSTPRSKALPFNIPVMIDKEPLSCTFHGKLNPFLSERLLLETFYFRNPLKYLDESALRCVCSRYFEVPFNA